MCKKLTNAVEAKNSCGSRFRGSEEGLDIKSDGHGEGGGEGHGNRRGDDDGEDRTLGGWNTDEHTTDTSEPGWLTTDL